MTPSPELPRIVLASQSPRRAELLRMLGLRIETAPADIDETFRPGEDPVAHAERLAREKTEAIAARHPDAVVIGSDTVVVVDGAVLGKPTDEADAVRMLLRLEGRAHDVATGVAVHWRTLRSGVERVTVRFRPFDRATAAAYAATGEPLDKAGAYGIQGFGATLVEGITGDYFAVMGLPIARMMRLLQEAGLHYNFRELRAVPPAEGG
jgi:septum formation protein